MSWAWLTADDKLDLPRFIRLCNKRLRLLSDQVTDLLGLCSAVGTFANGATNPSIAGAHIWKTANTVSTTITGLRDGVAGEELVIWSTDANTTLQHNATSFRMKSGANVTLTANETRRFATVDGTNWREV